MQEGHFLSLDKEGCRHRRQSRPQKDHLKYKDEYKPLLIRLRM
jgi:hypothetical protein